MSESDLDARLEEEREEGRRIGRKLVAGEALPRLQRFYDGQRSMERVAAYEHARKAATLGVLEEALATLKAES